MAHPFELFKAYDSICERLYSRLIGLLEKEIPTQKKKKHHYIPASYLKGFTDPRRSNILWVYEKGGNKIVAAPPHKTGLRIGYYSFMREGGQKDTDAFENTFEVLEGDAGNVLKKFGKLEEITPSDKAVMALFMGFLITRVPTYRNRVEEFASEAAKYFLMALAENPDALRQAREQYKKEEKPESDIEYEELREFILDESKYKIKPSPALSLVSMAYSAGHIGFLLLGMSWYFVPATPQHKYVTSDNPISYDLPPGEQKSTLSYGIAHNSLRLSFPISKELGMLAIWDNEEPTTRYSKPDNQIIKTINRRTARASNRFVFGPTKSEKINRMVQRQKGKEPAFEISFTKNHSEGGGIIQLKNLPGGK